MANVIYYKIQSNQLDQCGPHGHGQESLDLDATLRSLDKNKDGSFKRVETNLMPEQFEKLAELVSAFRNMKEDKDKCTVLEGQKVNYYHQSRMNIIQYLNKVGLKVNCRDEHQCLKSAEENPVESIKGNRLSYRKLQTLLKKYANDTNIQETYEKNPGKYKQLTDVEQEVKKYLEGKEKNPEVAKEKILVWLKDYQLSRDPVSIFLRLKLREHLKNFEYRDEEHKKGGGLIFKTLRLYFGKKAVRSVDPSNPLLSSAAGIALLDDLEFKFIPQPRKSVRVDKLDHFAATFRGHAEQLLVLPPTISEMTLSVNITIDPASGNISNIAFRNIKARGELSKRQKQIFNLQFFDLADRIRDSYRFYPGESGTVNHPVRLVK